MAGSHEVRGSIPLCSTIMNTTIHLGGRFLLGDLHGSNPARAQQSSGLLCEGEAKARVEGQKKDNGLRPRCPVRGWGPT